MIISTFGPGGELSVEVRQNHATPRLHILKCQVLRASPAMNFEPWGVAGGLDEGARGGLDHVVNGDNQVGGAYLVGEGLGAVSGLA